MSSPKKENETNSVSDDEIKLAQLKIQFQGTRMEDQETIESYVEKLQSTANSLAEINNPVSDQDLVLQLLAGLPSQYSSYQNIISSQSPLPDFPGACYMLHMYDDQIRQTQLKMQLHSTRKEDHETIESYVEKLKSIVNSLAAIDCPVSDSDMVLRLLAGLPSEYLPLQKTISSRCPLPNFEQACKMAYMQQGILLQDQEEPSSAFSKVLDAAGTVGNVLGAVATVTTVAGVAGAVGTATTVAAGAVGTVITVAAGVQWLAGKFGRRSDR